MDIYEELGVRTLINAAGAMSRYGGSLVDPGVYDAMREAGGKFCMLDELHEKVGERIAGLLEVEAAYVTASAASGLVLTTAACMAGTDPERIARLPDSSGMRSEVVIQRLHRIGYDQAIRLAGATLVVVEDDGEPPLAAMREAVGDDTAAIFCMAHRLEEPGSLRIEDYVALSRESGVPLVVDAASECPPLSTLTRFSREGADLVIFSGGKSLLGPQSTGLLVGRGDLIAACAANGNPFATVGRPMKVSSEEVIGFLKALESYLARDHEADRARWQAQVRRVEEALAGLPGIELQHLIKCGTYDVPLLGVRPLPGAGFTRSDIFSALEAGEPMVMVSEGYADDHVVINPHMLEPGQEEVVASRCAEVIRQLGQQG